jgi:hypothetical protein
MNSIAEAETVFFALLLATLFVHWLRLSYVSSRQRPPVWLSKFMVLLAALSCPLARAQETYTAASRNQSDVNAVINGPTHTAGNGDNINIPAGSCTWTSGTTVPSNIGISTGLQICPNAED